MKELDYNDSDLQKLGILMITPVKTKVDDSVEQKYLCIPLVTTKFKCFVPAN